MLASSSAAIGRHRQLQRRALSGGPLKATWNSEMLSSTRSTCQSLITAPQRRQGGGVGGGTTGRGEAGRSVWRRAPPGRRRHSEATPNSFLCVSGAAGGIVAPLEALTELHDVLLAPAAGRGEKGEWGWWARRAKGDWSAFRSIHLREGELAAAIAVPPPQTTGVLAAGECRRACHALQKLATIAALCDNECRT